MPETSSKYPIPKQFKIFVVDDHAVVREGLKRMLEKTGEFVVCGEAGDGYDALESLAKCTPDILIIDVGLKGMNGIELIKQIKQRFPPFPILVMSMFDEFIYAERAFRAGASGYIMKEESIDLVIEAMRRVLSGKTYMSEKMTERVLNNFSGVRKDPTCSPNDLLTDRELEVFQLLGKGLNKTQIADQLNLSVKTVDSYREQIKEKLKLSDSSELLQHAIQWVHSQSLN